MIIALIITFIALQIGQWVYSKKCIDRLKLIAQEWRDTAETYKDEITTYKLQETEMDSELPNVLSELKKPNTASV